MPPINQDIKKLKPLRDALLLVHTELLLLERQKYEDKYGRIRNPRMYFSLVLEDPEFQWLRVLSTLIVSIDVIIGSKKPVENEQLESLYEYIRSVLSPNKEGTEFEKKYYFAMQYFPSVIVAHGKVMQQVNKKTVGNRE